MRPGEFCRIVLGFRDNTVKLREKNSEKHIKCLQILEDDFHYITVNERDGRKVIYRYWLLWNDVVYKAEHVMLMPIFDKVTGVRVEKGKHYYRWVIKPSMKDLIACKLRFS